MSVNSRKDAILRTFERGEMVTVRAYRGAILTRRVWQDAQRGVLLCSEEAYQQAIKDGTEPLYAGFPKEDVIDPDHLPQVTRGEVQNE